MFCKMCGKSLPAEARFCSGCGAAVQPIAKETAPRTLDDFPADPHSRRSRAGLRVAGAILFIVAVMAAAVLLVIQIGNGAIFIAKKAIPEFLFVESPIWREFRLGAYDFFSGGKLLEGMIPDQITSQQYSLDRSVLAVHIADGKLWLVQTDGIHEIARDTQSYMLSLDGQRLAYTDTEDRLFLYEVRNGTTILITEEVAAEWSAFDLSPNGEQLVYRTADSSLFLWEAGQSKKIGSCSGQIAGVSPEAGYIFYLEDSGSLSAISKQGNTTAISSAVFVPGVGGSVYFNSGHTQLFFHDSNTEQSRIACVGEDGTLTVQNLTKNIGAIITPEGLQQTVRRTSPPDSSGGCYINTEGFSSFAGHFYRRSSPQGQTAWTLFYVDENWAVQTITESAKSISEYTDPTGESLCFQTAFNQRLYKVRRGDYENPVFITGNMGEYFNCTISPDGQTVYYMDDENNLWFQQDGCEAEIIAEDVFHQKIARSGRLLFITKEGDLYSSRDGSEKVFRHENVIFMYLVGDVVYFETENEDIYALYEDGEISIVREGRA